MQRNIILTGIPRSGTTLSCYLLNQMDDAVALMEPLNPLSFLGKTDADIVSQLKEFYCSQRQSILQEKIAASRGVAGSITDNVVSEELDYRTGERKKLIDCTQVEIKKSLSESFTLFIKHPSFFTAQLSLLLDHFECYAVIRNPISVLLSWNSVNMAVRNGHAPAAENYDKELKARLNKEESRYARQFILLSWFYEKYYIHLNTENIIRYEKLVASNGKCMEELFGRKLMAKHELASKNNNKLYDDDLKNRIAKNILSTDGFYWKYYDREEVERMIGV